MDERDLFLRLGVALATGLLIGLERGWHERGEEGGSGARIVGARTFALASLLGALSGLLAQELGGIVLGLAFVAFAGLIVVAHVIATREDRDYGVTTIIAALLTFALGAAAIQGHLALTAATAVVAGTVLGLRRQLHGWEERLERRELMAIFQLLLISVVVLPVLPDRGYGPWQALNPYVLWWLVVLMAAVSSLGYFGVKLAGPERGLALTAVFGGLASSTAVTLNFARLGRGQVALRPVLASGILLAAGAMFPRVLVLAAVVHPPLAVDLLAPLGTMALVAYAWAAWHWRRLRDTPNFEAQRLTNPLELRVALQLGALLAAVTVLAHALRAWLGDLGLYLLAAVSAVGDVDALTLSVAGMAAGALDPGVAARSVVIAVVSNTLVKALLAGLVGGLAVARQASAGLAATAAAGLLSLLAT
jgi:uncharacterized membrane protein (DUF4010 family)